MISFGPWSTMLGMGALFGTAVAVALSRTRTNAAANRFLALLLLAIVLKLMPYVIGYAGFYDTWPWLSFAPFETSLAIGPLVWLHVCALTAPRLPQRWGWHLLPAAALFAYYCVVFPFPLPAKDAWNTAVHEPWVSPAETAAALASLALYLALAWRQHAAYQRWLADHASDSDEHRLPWLRNFIVALAAMLLAWVAVSVATPLFQLDYFDRFPFYLGLMLLVFYLGLEGWRHAGHRYPHQAPATHEPPVSEPPAVEGRDWRAQGEAWLALTRDAGWWREPELGLDGLARHLGTNTAYLSRAFNEGLGVNFSEAIAGLRVAEVQRQLAAGTDEDLLGIALAAGFSSKSSFNRAFKAQTGQTPSQFRASLRPGGSES